MPRPLTSTVLLSFCLLLAGSATVTWLMKGRAHAYPDAPQGEFACLSYTPRSDTHHVRQAATAAQIERDLKQLSARTHCVRTYSVSNGLDQVPAIARRFGMRVMLGIWIGRDEPTNEYELTHGIAIANANRDVIDSIVVGNEVLLRREQPAEVLSDMLKRVHTATQLPVTYADVWDFWTKHPQLAQSASFITIHILPYWEDDPVGIDVALKHIQTIYAKMQALFPGRQLYVGETGWPSEGRQREAARPTLINQARFTREFIAYASTQHLPYNFIEAYDQPWKRELEGTVGGYWGLYDAQGHAKFPLTGVVIEDAQWWRGPIAGAMLAVLFLPLAWRQRAQGMAHFISIVVAGFALGAMLVLQGDYLLKANRNALEWLVSVTWMVCCDALFVVTLLRFRDDDGEHSYQPSIVARLDDKLQFAVLLAVSYINVGLTFDDRYRDFPTEFLVLPATLLIVHRIMRGRFIGRASQERALFASWCGLSALFIAVNEGPRNLSALLWCGLCVLLSLALLPPAQTQVQQRA